MVVCKRDSNGKREPRPASESVNDRRSRLGEGGPVFLPKRKPSALAQALLASAPEQVTAYDDVWFAGRPST